MQSSMLRQRPHLVTLGRWISSCSLMKCTQCRGDFFKKARIRSNSSMSPISCGNYGKCQLDERSRTRTGGVKFKEHTLNSHSFDKFKLFSLLLFVFTVFQKENVLDLRRHIRWEEKTGIIVTPRHVETVLGARKFQLHFSVTIFLQTGKENTVVSQTFVVQAKILSLRTNTCTSLNFSEPQQSEIESAR